MKWYHILFVCLYACMVAGLMTLKILKFGTKRRGVLKMVTSLSFVFVAIWGAATQGGSSILVGVALCFASLGDLLLIFRAKRITFVLGVMSFFVCSVLLSAYSVVVFGMHWWALAVYIAYLASNILCQVFKVYKFGSNRVYLNLYSAAVGLCGSLGLALLFAGDIAALVFGFGCLCYLVSDIILGLYMFRFRNNIMDAVNSFFYFPGMLLVAISLLL